MAKVLITARTVAETPAAIEALEAAGHVVLIRSTPAPLDRAWLQAQVREADALVFAMEPMDAALLAAAPRLKVIARPGVGTDNVDLAEATRRGVVVTIAVGTNEQSVADLTFGLLLEAARGMSSAAAGVRAGGWDRVTGIELWRKTIAVVGFGRIGQAVARRARGFDMRVLAVARTRDEPQARRDGIEYADLDAALAQADVVSLHLPLTPDTENLIDEVALGRMKHGALLINTARGGLVNEQALAAAVRSGRLAGAAVDVLCVQGVKSESALIGVPGIVVTPHMGTFTHESKRRVAMSVSRSLIAALAGERPEHVANPAVFERRRTGLCTPCIKSA